MTLHLTRAVLDTDARAAALAPLLDPPSPDRALDAHHRLIWMLFPGKRRTRDFLWRADGKGRFLILSHRPPAQSELFHALQTTELAPRLAPGDRLGFALRANATRDRPLPRGAPDRRVDLVMTKLRHTPARTGGAPSARPAERARIARCVAADWLARQGTRCGFRPRRTHVDRYSVRRIKRANAHHITFGVLDITGTLIIDTPDIFLTALGAGFGRARAFGCGLMLIRRI